MGFWSALPAVVKAAGISAGGSILSGILGNRAASGVSSGSRKADRAQRAYNQEWDIGIPFHKLGNDSRNQIFADSQTSLDMDREHANRSIADQYAMAKGEGATLQEFLGSPVPGGAGTGATSTMGNQASQMQASATQMAQQERQNRWQSSENAKNRNMQLLNTIVEAGQGLGNFLNTRRGQDVQTEGIQAQERNVKITAQANIKSSEISASAAKYVADTNREIADQRFGLDEQQYREITRPAAAAALGISKEQLKIAQNEVVTSGPEYQKFIKMASMSAENNVVFELMKRHNITLDSPEMDDVAWGNFLTDLAVVSPNSALGRLASDILRGAGFDADFVPSKGSRQSRAR